MGVTAAKLHISKGVQLISRTAIEELDPTDREVTGPCCWLTDTDFLQAL
jgi:hypothetical protein